MRFKPISEWKWSVKNDRLVVSLQDELGQKFYCKTHFIYSSLSNPPMPEQDFCIADAQLLEIYKEGFAEIRLNEGSCLDLGINAVACARFVSCTSSMTRYFIPHRNNVYFKTGDVVSLYAPNGEICDCVVLDEIDRDNKTSLMIVNPSFQTYDGRILSIGNKLRVDPGVINKFREMRTTRYA